MHIQKIDNTNFGAGRAVSVTGMPTSNITPKVINRIGNLASRYGLKVSIDRLGGISMPSTRYIVYADDLKTGALTLYKDFDIVDLQKNPLEKIFGSISRVHLSRKIYNTVKQLVTLANKSGN